MGGAMTYTWQILEMYKNADNQATEVRYHLTLTDGDFSVETEGYYKFSTLNNIFPELTENQVVYWIENDSSQDVIGAIKSRLNEQLNAVKAGNSAVRAPWLGSETFTVQI